MDKLTFSRRHEEIVAVFRLTTVALAAYWLAIFIATHLPARSLPKLSSDKLYHMLAFGGLAFLLAWCLPITRRGMAMHLLLVSAIVLAYACLDEWSQQFAAGRSSDWKDVVADGVGSAVGLLCFLVARTVVLRLPALERWMKRLKIAPNMTPPAPAQASPR
jgi:TRAP-type uncharacterized transport system fused permease subunit